MLTCPAPGLLKQAIQSPSRAQLVDHIPTTSRLPVVIISNIHQCQSFHKSSHKPINRLEGRRRLAHLVVEEGWPMRRAVERFQVSPATASRWVGRYRAGQPMEDRSCRPHHSPGRLARRTERRIIALRLNRRWGPHRIAYHLGLARSTVGRILARYNMPRLTEVDQATGLAVRRPPPVRYEKTNPGELEA